MKISVKLGMVRLDNVGVIFMVSNMIATSCTKFEDVRYKYVKIIFVVCKND